MTGHGSTSHERKLRFPCAVTSNLHADSRTYGLLSSSALGSVLKQSPALHTSADFCWLSLLRKGWHLLHSFEHIVCRWTSCLVALFVNPTHQFCFIDPWLHSSCDDDGLNSPTTTIRPTRKQFLLLERLLSSVRSHCWSFRACMLLLLVTPNEMQRTTVRGSIQTRLACLPVGDSVYAMVSCGCTLSPFSRHASWRRLAPAAMRFLAKDRQSLGRKEVVGLRWL